MKYKLLSVALLTLSSFAFAQQKGSFWKASTQKDYVALDSRMQLPENNLFQLDVQSMSIQLISASPRTALQKGSVIILSLPNDLGQMERFSIYENSNMDPALAARFPEIKSYIGIGVDNPTSTAFFSTSPLGFKSMVLSADKPAVFIEPVSQDLTTYSVYKKSDKKQAFTPFECGVIDEVQGDIDPSALRPNADDGQLRTFRLAMSVTG